MTALQQYAQYFIRQRAYAAVCDELKPKAIKELERFGGKADAGGVQFHLGVNTTKEFPDDVRAAIGAIKRDAEDQGRVLVTSKQTIVAEIPRSTVKNVLAKVAAYAKAFKVRRRKR